MAVQHGTITGDAVHVPYAGTFANAAARTGATGLDSTQHGKLFRQLDDNSLWMLVSTSPLAWKSLSPDKVANAGYADNAGYASSAGNAGKLNGKAEGSLSVSYANSANYANSAGSAGSAPANGGTAEAVSGVMVGDVFTLPSGGTWAYISSYCTFSGDNNWRTSKSVVSGGTRIGISNGVTIAIKKA